MYALFCLAEKCLSLVILRTGFWNIWAHAGALAGVISRRSPPSKHHRSKQGGLCWCLWATVHFKQTDLSRKKEFSSPHLPPKWKYHPFRHRVGKSVFPHLMGFFAGAFLPVFLWWTFGLLGFLHKSGSFFQGVTWQLPGNPSARVLLAAASQRGGHCGMQRDLLQ